MKIKLLFLGILCCSLAKAQNLYVDYDGISVYYEIENTGKATYCEGNASKDKNYSDAIIILWKVTLSIKNESDKPIATNMASIATISIAPEPAMKSSEYCQYKLLDSFGPNDGFGEQNISMWPISTTQITQINPGEIVSNSAYLYLYEGQTPEVSNKKFGGYEFINDAEGNLSEKPKNKTEIVSEEKIKSKPKTEAKEESKTAPAKSSPEFRQRMSINPTFGQDGFGGHVTIVYAFNLCSGKVLMSYGYEELALDYVFYKGERYTPRNLSLDDFSNYMGDIATGVMYHTNKGCTDCARTKIKTAEIEKIPTTFETGCNGATSVVVPSSYSQTKDPTTFFAGFFDTSVKIKGDISPLINDFELNLANKKKLRSLVSEANTYKDDNPKKRKLLNQALLFAKTPSEITDIKTQLERLTNKQK